MGEPFISDSDFLKMCRTARLDIILSAIKAGVNINAKASDGSTALIQAVLNNTAYRIIEVLVKAGADVNAINSQGMNALMVSVFPVSENASNSEIDNMTKIISILVEAGADYTIRDNEANATVLDYALFMDKTHEIHPLISSEIIKLCSSKSHTPSQNDISINASEDDIPIFTPPGSSSSSDDIPTFTPPVHNGPVCFHHNDTPAAANCSRCGKNICHECADMFRVLVGEYAGKVLCYDCWRDIVNENIELLKQNKAEIKSAFVRSLIGIVLGFLFGLFQGASAQDFSTGLGVGFVYACIGGVFLNAMKAFLLMAWDALKIAFSGQFGFITIISLAFNIAIIIFQCIWYTVSNTVRYIIYLRRTSGFIEEDTAALRQMEDYMRYSIARSRNSGASLDSLMASGGELYNNSYAQAVRSEGETSANNRLEQVVFSVARNGEIIWDFPKY